MQVRKQQLELGMEHLGLQLVRRRSLAGKAGTKEAGRSSNLQPFKESKRAPFCFSGWSAGIKCRSEGKGFGLPRPQPFQTRKFHRSPDVWFPLPIIWQHYVLSPTRKQAPLSRHHQVATWPAGFCHVPGPQASEVAMYQVLSWWR